MKIQIHNHLFKERIKNLLRESESKESYGRQESNEICDITAYSTTEWIDHEIYIRFEINFYPKHIKDDYDDMLLKAKSIGSKIRSQQRTGLFIYSKSFQPAAQLVDELIDDISNKLIDDEQDVYTYFGQFVTKHNLRFRTSEDGHHNPIRVINSVVVD